MSQPGQLAPGTWGPQEDPDNPRPPLLETSGGGVRLSVPTPNAGKIVKPTYSEANVDGHGNQKPVTPNSGLAKLGALILLLMGGMSGGADAMKAGAMDWVPGRSNFGAASKGRKRCR